MNTLAERSGRTYPHNAIYEILTFRMPTEKRNEPKKYPKATCLKFERILKELLGFNSPGISGELDT